MKAINWKDKDNATVVEINKPPLTQKETVLVKVQYSAIDTATTAILAGKWYASFLHKFTDPLVLGWHFAGVVEKSSDSDFSAGDVVWGHLQYDRATEQGAFSEYVAVAADSCAKIPAKDVKSVAKYAAVATEALTALQALRDVGGLDKDMQVLVVGAVGGVGSAAVSISKALGAHVTAVCSAKDVAYVKDTLGANKVLTKEDDPFKKNYHVIFDTPNVLSPRTCLRHLYPHGTYVATIPSVGLMTTGLITSLCGSKKMAAVEVVSKQADLELVSTWIANGSLPVSVESQFAVRDVQKALGAFNKRSKVKGRTLIKVEGGW